MYLQCGGAPSPKCRTGAGVGVDDLLRARVMNMAWVFQLAYRLLQRRILGDQLQCERHVGVLRGASLLDRSLRALQRVLYAGFDFGTNGQVDGEEAHRNSRADPKTPGTHGAQTIIEREPSLRRELGGASSSWRETGMAIRA